MAVGSTAGCGSLDSSFFTNTSGPLPQLYLHQHTCIYPHSPTVAIWALLQLEDLICPSGSRGMVSYREEGKKWQPHIAVLSSNQHKHPELNISKYSSDLTDKKFPTSSRIPTGAVVSLQPPTDSPTSQSESLSR